MVWLNTMVFLPFFLYVTHPQPCPLRRALEIPPQCRKPMFFCLRQHTGRRYNKEGVKESGGALERNRGGRWRQTNILMPKVGGCISNNRLRQHWDPLLGFGIAPSSEANIYPPGEQSVQGSMPHRQAVTCFCPTPPLLPLPHVHKTAWATVCSAARFMEENDNNSNGHRWKMTNLIPRPWSITERWN